MVTFLLLVSLLVSLLAFIAVVTAAVRLSLVVDYANTSLNVLERLSLYLTVYERTRRG